MAITLLTAGKNHVTDQFSTVTVDTTGATLLVAINASNGSITDSVGGNNNNSSWVNLTAEAASGCGFRLSYCLNPTYVGASHAITCTLGGSDSNRLHVLVFDSDGAMSFDQSASKTDAGGVSTGSSSTSGLTPGSDGALFVAGLALSYFVNTSNLASTNGFTVPTSPVTLADPSTTSPSARGLISGYFVQSTAANKNADWSWTTNSPSASGMATFLEEQATAPVLSTPTVTSVTATGATVGATTTTPTGTAYFLSRTSATPASVATVKSTGNSTAVSATAIAYTFDDFDTGSGYWVDIAQNDGSTDSSAVLTAGPIYPGTWRPASDVSSTGWVYSTGSTYYGVIDEDAAGDTDYITSPALSTTPSTIVFGLDRTLPGDGSIAYTFNVRHKVSTGVCKLKAYLTNAAGTSFGDSGDVSVGTAVTTTTVSITPSADCTRLRIDMFTL